MIRPLTKDELPQLPRLGALFWKEAGLPGSVVPEVVVAGWSALFDAGFGEILGSFEGDTLQGVLGYLVHPDLNDGNLVAMEAFWYVDPAARGAGLRLMKEFERRASGRGARRLIMGRTARLSTEALDKIYQRFGYVETETLFVKTLS